MLVVGTVVLYLGIAPTITLATDLIVSAAPPERAGSASSLSETGIELGGALGIAVLGSVGIGVYRDQLGGSIPNAVPDGVAGGAIDTLGGAVDAAEDLPSGLAGGAARCCSCCLRGRVDGGLAGERRTDGDAGGDRADRLAQRRCTRLGR